MWRMTRRHQRDAAAAEDVEEEAGAMAVAVASLCAVGDTEREAETFAVSHNAPVLHEACAPAIPGLNPPSCID